MKIFKVKFHWNILYFFLKIKIIFITNNKNNNIKIICRHLDNHQLWVPNYFAIHTFRIIMFSIQVSTQSINIII